MDIPPDASQPHGLFESHPRDFGGNRYVYPVVSRRAGGISIGVNLNPDRRCTFHCVYCQVDRTEPCRVEPVDLARLREELEWMLDDVLSGAIFEQDPFRGAPARLRRLNDIALSGDGEPTLSPSFPEAVDVCAAARRQRGLEAVNIVLITNASLLDQPRVAAALEVLDANGGEIWAKLDAGTEGYYRRVARSAVPWPRILDNLRRTAVARPIVVQTLFARLDGQSPPPEEIEAYCRRLREITAAGGQIKLVQIHTVARPPAEHWVAPLADAEVDAVVDTVRRATGLTVAGFYGA
jgi:wyosine [tRNA(Phe)-imidazoG37] synthetase (radical SAM superfamily)